MDETGDRVAELDLLIGDAVATQNRAIRLLHFRRAAIHDLGQRVEITFGGIGENREGGDGAAPHGVDIAQRVGCGDCAECEGIVDDRREEVDRLDQGQIFS
jgi:hypothetical protein